MLYYRPKEIIKKKLKIWQLVILVIITTTVSATLLRINNVKMSERRDAVLKADEEGDLQKIEDRLYNLQQFVSLHMNASTGPFYLEHTYRRDVQNTMEDAKKHSNNSDQKAYARAQARCEANYANRGWSLYVNCYNQELEKLGSSNSNFSTNVTLPNSNLYRHNYSSNAFTLDWAGLSIIVNLTLILILILKIGFNITEKILFRLKKQKNP